MQRRDYLLVLLFLAAAPCSCLGADGAPADEPRAIKPIIEVGDSWTYRGKGIIRPDVDQYKIRVSFVSDKVVLAVATRESDGREFDSTWTTEWNFSVSYSGIVYTPHTETFAFPMHVGDTHKTSFTGIRKRGNPLNRVHDLTVRVLGWVDVVVPAGKFHAMQVEAAGTYRTFDGSDGGGGNEQYTYWYVPEVRRWVKLAFNISGREGGEELVEYKLGQ